ncbi:MAG: glucose-1-phosphate adenylyltransferase subunit GlgD [Bacillales bacterium]|nr:glucose-1-phosphate adenylyltransferase subunit GlgD [Bacillales bacterium]
MARILGLVNLHSSPDFEPITKNRTTGTLALLGRYAIMDVPLSNFSNSGINTVGVLVNKGLRSVIKHMDNAMSYAHNTKLGNTVICYNEKYANDFIYNTDINNIVENKWLFEEQSYKYVVIAPAHILYRLDFNKVIEEHIKNEASVTCVYSKCSSGKVDYIGRPIMDINNFGLLTGIKKNLGVEDNVNLSLETYVISIEKLYELIVLAQKTSKFFSLSDVINFICNTSSVHTYEYTGYVSMVTSMTGYLKTSLDLLDFNVLNQLFNNDWPIYTNTHDTPPTRYLANAWVRNSFVSNGALINGKVENSVICRDTKIGDSAHVKNSIILSGSEVAQDAVLEYVIVDKNAKVIHVKELKGTLEKPIYVGQGDII